MAKPSLFEKPAVRSKVINSTKMVPVLHTLLMKGSSPKDSSRYIKEIVIIYVNIVVNIRDTK